MSRLMIVEVPSYTCEFKGIREVAELIRCKECKHRPVKEDANGENYGFNLIEPTEDDDICPCLVDDGWYSWMPEDNFYCGYGERKDNDS